MNAPNTDRRQLTKAEIALAFKRLRELPKEQGGTKRKQGRPEGSVGGSNKSPSKRGINHEPSADAVLRHVDEKAPETQRSVQQ